MRSTTRVTEVALAERLCRSMNGAAAERFADVLEALGPAGPADVSPLPEDDRTWIAAGLDQVTTADRERWSMTLLELEKDGVRCITVADEEYPTNLQMVQNRPPVLFVRGELRPEDTRAIAVVGTRSAGPEGVAAATAISQKLVARGVTVVSGLAEGIDTAAHSAALSSGGRTIAVFGTGISRVYPAKNRVLADEVARSGACVSQFLPDQSPTRWTFPVRNVVTSGLSIGTVVVEAGPTSGAKLQAHDALRHGKRLFLLRRLVEQQEWAKDLATRPEVTAVDDIDEIVRAVETDLRLDAALL